jgi:hypothetical protein
MSRVNFSSICVYHIIVDKYLVPGGDEIGVYIEGDLQISVHAEKAGQGAIRGIVKCHAVQAVNRSVTQEMLVLVRGKLGRSEKSGRSLRRSTASSAGYV